MNKAPTTLIIMDGFGLTDPGPGNAVSLARTPQLDRLFAEYAHTTLSASGLDVGLPAGQMGNSEVGHTNIGGGRVVFQDLPRISRAIDDGSFFENAAYNKAMDDCLSKGSSLHLYGLLSDGGVHSHIQHLYALLQSNPLPREEWREDPDAFKSLMEERADTEDNAPMYRY